MRAAENRKEMPGIGPQTFIRQHSKSWIITSIARKLTKLLIALCGRARESSSASGWRSICGFKALENNADDPARFLPNRSRKVSGKYSRTQIMFDVRACCKIYAARVLWLRPPPENGQKFPHTFLFQAEANVVIFSQTLHVKAIPSPSANSAVTARRLKQGRLLRWAPVRRGLHAPEHLCMQF